MKKIFVTTIFCFLLVIGISAQQSTSFSYQGKLNSSSAPANGTYDFKFELFSVLTNGTAIGTVNSNNVQVTSGNFTVQLDFGANAFNGTDRYLEISVKLPSESNFTTLTPRQKISSVPYAIKAINADSATVAQTANNATNLGGISANNYLLNTGDGSQLVNVNGGFKWNVITSNQQAQPNNGYIANGNSEVTITLPPNPQIGDSIRIAGRRGDSVGFSWILAKNIGQDVSTEAWSEREIQRAYVSVASSANGQKLFAAEIGGKLYTSENAGISWTVRESNRTWQSVASSADGTFLAAVAANGLIWTSFNSGGTWIPRESNRLWRAITTSADGTKLAAAVSGGQIYISSDSGLTWIPRESNRSWVAITSSADGTKLVAVADNDQIYTSTDSGNTWTARETARNWSAITSSADGTKLAAVANPGTIYTSTDSGVTWIPRGVPFPLLGTSITSSADGTTLYATSDNGFVIVSYDSGNSWSNAYLPANGQFRSIACSSNCLRVVAAGINTKLYTYRIASGQLGSFLELVYVGNGSFFAVNQR